MKKIIIKILIVLAVLIAFDRVFYYFFKNKVFNSIISGETGGSLNYLISQKKGIDFLILGTSRAVKQIDPSILFDGKPKGYNAGIHGIGEIIYNDVLFDILLSKRIIPKILILQIDNFWFYRKTIDNKELIALYPFIDESKRLQYYIKINRYEERVKLFFNSYRFNGKLLNIIKNYLSRNSSPNSSGYDPSPCSYSDSVNTELTYRNAPLPDTNYNIADTIRLDALNNIIQNAKKYNIQLIVVQPPSFKNVMRMKCSNKLFDSIIVRKNHIAYIDYSNLKQSNELDVPRLWRDCYHLNIEGATIFSKMLNDTIKKICKIPL